MIKPNWDIFKAKFSENPQDNFEWFCYLLFSKEYNQPYGTHRYKNQSGIETDPIEIGDEVIGWQSKFYEDTLSNHKDDLLATLSKTKRDNPNIIKIIENNNTHVQVNTEVSRRYTILNKSNKGLDRLSAILQDKNIENYYKRRTVEVLASLTFQKHDILTRDRIKMFSKIFTKKSSIKSFMYAFDNYYIDLDMLIQNAFHNTLPLYLQNNKFHTIENGKEISTQREVDEEILNEII